MLTEGDVERKRKGKEMEQWTEKEVKAVYLSLKNFGTSPFRRESMRE